MIHNDADPFQGVGQRKSATLTPKNSPTRTKIVVFALNKVKNEPKSASNGSKKAKKGVYGPKIPLIADLGGNPTPSFAEHISSGFGG